MFILLFSWKNFLKLTLLNFEFLNIRTILKGGLIQGNDTDITDPEQINFV